MTGWREQQIHTSGPVRKMSENQVERKSEKKKNEKKERKETKRKETSKEKRTKGKKEKACLALHSCKFDETKMKERDQFGVHDDRFLCTLNETTKKPTREK